MKAPLGAIVIAAHNEEAVIARCLAALSSVIVSGAAQVVVVCNGCGDDTAAIARQFDSVEVVELEVASKVGALRTGDQLAVPGPRIYLDADVVMTGAAAMAVLSRLSTGGTLAARPPIRFDSTGARWPVRRWYEVRERLPSISRALWGAGTYALSIDGRARFGEFPDIVSDDLFIDSLFSEAETDIVDTDPVIVTTPRRTGDLLKILIRTYRTQGDVQRDDSHIPISRGQRGQLRDILALVRRQPGLVLSAAVYAVLIFIARLRARFRSRQGAWERDNSSRST
ncbi:glycosyltransferase involved in cell wall biosynthesis [Marisediminicola sp. UYEF4]|uniref:glycosyltransferase n=1 Tax=Marisediminicola sp. UYEF4 TaxID=1756384 RepID=UPI003398F3C9